MSTATPETESPRRIPEWKRICLRVLAVLASLGSLLALWIGERAKADHDLQLIIQNRVRPGQAVAVRAILLSGLESVQGPRLVTGEVELRMLDGSGRELSRTLLRPDGGVTMQGRLQVPRVEPGNYVLAAEVPVPDGPAARCRKALRVHPAGGQLVASGRVAGALQHFALGKLRAKGEAQPPAPFEARVVGGSCIPDQPCQVLVHVGAPAARLEVHPERSVEVTEGPTPSGATEGLVSVTLKVHGPEGQLALRAVRDGTQVAERSLRLPVGLGEVGLWLERPVVELGEVPRLRVATPPGRVRLILDAYRDGDWLRSRGVAAPGADTSLPLPFEGLDEGLWRLQVRADPFSSEGSGARLFFVRPPGLDDAALLRVLEAVGTPAGEAPTFARGEPLPAWALADLSTTAAFLLAPRELDRAPQPVAASGRPTQLRRLSHTRNVLRFAVGAMLVLSAFVVSGTMVRRELGEQAWTRRALREAGDLTADAPGNRRRQAFWLWTTAAGVAVAFLLAALLIIAKPLWF